MKKIRNIALLAILMIGAGSCFFSCASKPPLPVLGEVPSFTLIDQKGQKLESAQLRGSIWVADFIYTGCGTECPLLTQRMADLQKSLAPEKTPVRFVSFSVDPENDTPERLNDYADKFHVDAKQWSFLTGDPVVMQKTVLEGFKLSLGKVSSADIFHSNKLALVDAEGKIRGYFDADESGKSALLAAIRTLQNSK